jgi:hypothetical protein
MYNRTALGGAGSGDLPRHDKFSSSNLIAAFCPNPTQPLGKVGGVQYVDLQVFGLPNSIIYKILIVVLSWLGLRRSGRRRWRTETIPLIIGYRVPDII